MIPYTGDYIEHIDDSINNFKYYTFTPRPLMHGDMYKMDDELSALLIEAHRNVGFLEGLLKYAPNKNVFSELMLLKECTYSLMVDYDGPSFQEVLVSRGGDKGDIARITKLELVLRCINNCELNSQWNPCICPTECMRSKVVLLNEASDTFLQLIYGCVALPF